jgi:hypothetical protein
VGLLEKKKGLPMKKLVLTIATVATLAAGRVRPPKRVAGGAS